MSFKQTYYTSCENGLRGGKGFQINAASEGIDASALQEIERLGLYVPPISAPSRPTPEEIQSFPVSLLFQRLNDGAAILGQARYIGADYSGRYGNYFTHSIISSDPERDLKEQGVLPIELWGAPGWTTTESATTSLPVLNNLETAGIVYQDTVIKFLTESSRIDTLPAFLTAVEQALSTGRRIVMVDTDQSVAMWISAASYVLPHHLTLRLTFNTYVKNPYLTDFLIVGTTADSDFNFAPHEINHQFFVFDFEGQRFTPITEVTPFARMASDAFRLGHMHLVSQFSDFVERIAPDLRVEELAPAFACHVLGNGLAPASAIGSSTLAWCATRLGSLDVQTLKAIVESVIEQSPERAEVLSAYTNLYASAILPTTRSDLRKAIELPYLEYLIRQASLDVPVTTLNQVAERLHVDFGAGLDANVLMLSWVNRVRQCPDIERLPALFAIGDKIGFLNAPDDVLNIVGEELLGPCLARPEVTDLILRYIARPGMTSIVTGVAAFLETQVGNPDAFRPYTAALAHDEIHKILARYAFAQQSLAFFFRLIGARASDLAVNPQPRLDAFEECIEAIKALLKSVPDDLLENAFDAVWQHQPTLSEAIQLLDLLERMRLTNSSIPRRLTDLIRGCPLTDLKPTEQQLLERLGARGIFYPRLGDKQILIDAYRIPAELKMSGELLPDELRASIFYLGKATTLDRSLIAQAVSEIARYLTQVKDTERHAELLLQGYRQLDSHSFLESYVHTINALVKDPTSTRARIVARFIRIANLAAKGGGNMVATRILDSLSVAGGKPWRSKEMQQIAKELSDSPMALRSWLMRVEAAKSEVASQGFLNKLFRRGDKQ